MMSDNTVDHWTAYVSSVCGRRPGEPRRATRECAVASCSGAEEVSVEGHLGLMAPRIEVATRP